MGGAIKRYENEELSLLRLRANCTIANAEPQLEMGYQSYLDRPKPLPPKHRRLIM